MSAARPAPSGPGSTRGGPLGRRESRWSRADLERLRYAAGGTLVERGRSLFGPDSLTWRVNREAVLLLGGGRALLLQIAHPLVAAGVADHSDFEKAPLQRLWRTLDLTLTTTFGNAAAALGAVRQIERVHARVRGALDADVGPFPRGTRYDANDPELQHWVHATLVDSALLSYERFVGPLSAAEQRAYYEESKIGARLFGIPERVIPPTLAAFRRYLRDMLRGPTLAVGPASRTIAASLLDPPLPAGLRQLAGSTRLITVGLLPPVLRRRYGFAWSTARERALRAVAAMLRTGLPLVPSFARAFPHARRAAQMGDRVVGSQPMRKNIDVRKDAETQRTAR